MAMNVGLDKCFTFINCQMQPGGRPRHAAEEFPRRRAVTISRQTGSGGHAVAEKLAEYLQAEAPIQKCPWTVFDRNLVEKVIEDHHLPKRLAQFMPEDRISEMADTMDELFGLHPPSWTLVRQTSDTILHLAELGGVIIIGRGANVITNKQDYVFHVRLVGSLDHRVEYLQQRLELSRKAALAFIRKEDKGRKRYLKKYFGKDIEDPLLYHMVINTDWVGFDEAARLIAQAVVGAPEPVAA